MSKTHKDLVKIIEKYLSAVDGISVAALAKHIIEAGWTNPGCCGICDYYNPEELTCSVKFDSSGENLAVPFNYYCADCKKRK
jgi:hypothetical protein